MGLKSKRQAGVVEDRISKLPDSVLCHMLSFLRTKYAVRTSILSKRWKNIWASVPDLDFDLEDFSYVAFPMFIERVLLLRDSSDIRKFRLRYLWVENFSRIDGWIRAVIKRNAVQLDLCVGTCQGQNLELPKSLFTCKTLKVLKLSLDFITNTPASGCFPSLKSLHVIAHTLTAYKGSMGKLFSCCPVLEDLTIVGDIEGDIELDADIDLNISAPELKTLTIRFSTAYDYNHGYNFFINAPKLENFNLDQEALSNYCWGNARSLVKANIVLYNYFAESQPEPAFANRATALLAGISNVSYLSISTHFLEASCLPAFDNLRKLKLVVHDCRCCWAEFFKRSPNLKYLVLEFGDCEEYYSCSYDMQEHPEHPWNPPEFVPNCLLSHLKTISIRGFSGRQDEMEAVKYFLKNGEVLDKMTIFAGENSEPLMYTKEELCKKFLMFPRGSNTCEVEFI